MRRDLLSRCAEVLLGTLTAFFSSGCGGQAIRRPRLTIERRTPEIWLQHGPQSRISRSMIQLVQKLRSDDPWTTLRRIHRWIASHSRPFRGIKAHVLRRRTASSLFRSLHLSGCGDWGLLFTALARAAGFPAVYVEAVHKDWARRWLDGDEQGPHMGHVFIEVYIKGEWILVDSTEGFYWRKYNPNDANLPRGYYAFAKGRDAWDLGLRGIFALNQSLEFVAEYIDDLKLHRVSYQRGFLTPTLVLIAPRPAYRVLRRKYPSIRFRHMSIHKMRRHPGRANGIEVLILLPREGLASKLRLLSDPLDIDFEKIVHMTAPGAHPRGLMVKGRAICLATGDTPISLAETSSHLIGVSPDRETSLILSRCGISPRKRPAPRPKTSLIHPAAPRPSSSTSRKPSTGASQPRGTNP